MQKISIIAFLKFDYFQLKFLCNSDFHIPVPHNIIFTENYESTSRENICQKKEDAKKILQIKK